MKNGIKEPHIIFGHMNLTRFLPLFLAINFSTFCFFSDLNVIGLKNGFNGIIILNLFIDIVFILSSLILFFMFKKNIEINLKYFLFFDFLFLYQIIQVTTIIIILIPFFISNIKYDFVTFSQILITISLIIFYKTILFKIFYYINNKYQEKNGEHEVITIF